MIALRPPSSASLPTGAGCPLHRLAWLCLGMFFTVSLNAADPSPGERLFAVHVQPLLARKCLPCHGEGDQGLKGDLDLRSRSAMLQGGASSQPALVPGQPHASLLYRAATWEDPDLEMPPKENDRLSPEELDALRAWIEADAPWPADQRAETIRQSFAEGVTVSTSGGLTREWDRRRYRASDLWAYQPRKRHLPPPAPDATHPIDAFLTPRQRELQISPAPRATPDILIRRLHYTLLGLPPSPEDVQSFLAEASTDDQAYPRLLDRLLASPHHGEHLARHWLDHTRYADSSGLANDYERPNAWRYRDYVVRAFNRDEPYADFVTRQIAGDERDPDDPENLIAVGFLRMGPWEQTGMSVPKITRQQFLDDVTDSVGQVFLAHALQCARCHDHKFDPIPTRDYYALQAVFTPTQFADRSAPFLPEENLSGFQEKDYLKERIARYQGILQEIEAKETAAARHWHAQRNLPYLPRHQALKQGLPEDQIVPARLGLSAHDLGMERIARKSLERHRWELDRYEPLAFSVYSGEPRTLNAVKSRLPLPPPSPSPPPDHAERTTHILIGGDPFSPGDAVTPGVLSAADWQDAALPTTLDGRRLALASWITHPDNPLTWRVIANRLWAWHFGRGLAANPNHFGTTGSKPSHPELLDWLADSLLDSGGSLKNLQRLILTSEAFQRAARSHHPLPQTLESSDPLGQSYAAFLPRRLTAEELRDSFLTVSGEMNRMLGGIPAKPDIHPEAALQPRMIMGTYAPAYQPSPQPSQRNRRSLYALKLRGLRDPFMETFNQPSPDKACEGREVSTVSPQALALMHGQDVRDRALALAHHVLRKTTGRSDETTLHALFQQVYQRPPLPREMESCLNFWNDSLPHLQQPPPPTSFPTQVIRQAKEEITGEPFTFTEELEALRDYQPDLQGHQVDARTRALAEIALVLLNSNAFVYVY